MPRAPNTQLFQPVKDTGEIAQELGVTRQRVDAIIGAALAKLRRELEKRHVSKADDLLPD